MSKRTRMQVVGAAATTIVVAAAIIAFFIIGSAGTTAPESANASPTPSATATQSAPTIARFDAGTPSRLKIDKIGVDAPVLALGTAPDGSQEVPTTLTDTAWWRDGSHPGASGNAVIAGHAAHALTDDGVFDKLGALKNGDQFQIVADEGTVDYTVTGRDEIETANFADYADRIYSRDGDPGSVLMTCGSWNGQRWETTTIIWATMSSHEP